MVLTFVQARHLGDFAKRDITKENSRNEIILNDIIGNGTLFVVGECSMVLTAKWKYPRSPDGVSDSMISPGIKALGRNACGLSDGFVGCWTPFWENVSKDMFNCMTAAYSADNVMMPWPTHVHKTFDCPEGANMCLWANCAMRASWQLLVERQPNGTEGCVIYHHDSSPAIIARK
jgi:hypothetical protein